MTPPTGVSSSAPEVQVTPIHDMTLEEVQAEIIFMGIAVDPATITSFDTRH
jgi:hypothetical protein